MKQWGSVHIYSKHGVQVFNREAEAGQSPSPECPVQAVLLLSISHLAPQISVFRSKLDISAYETEYHVLKP